jgi:poly-gamma-glutamate capsule biosynthesis protein CapA/YwtB (metallophosphatase superfamily)
MPAMSQAGGIDVVTMANNHAGDFGDQALLDGLRTLRRDGIATVGAGRNSAVAYRPAVLTRLGLKIAFVGFSVVPPRRWEATSRSAGVAWGLPKHVREAVRVAARRSDVVVAYFHWGLEGRSTPDPAQRALARVALHAGATVVLGAHPHVLQPMTLSRGRLVAYSLGNFVFAPRGREARRTGVLHVLLARRRVLSARLEPAEIVGTRPRLVAAGR